MLDKGELAATGTSFFWATSAIFFTIAGRRVSARVVNLVRLVMAAFLICFVHWACENTLFPYHTEGWRWGYLAISAVLGLVIGDAALFAAYVLIGPQLSMLIMTITPVFCALAARCCFGESISAVEMIGMAVTLGAIGWVVTEGRAERRARARQQTAEPSTQVPTPDRSASDYSRGVMLALVGALGQTANLIFTKYALVGDYSTLSATQVRISISAVVLLLIAVFRGELGWTLKRLKDAKAMWMTAGGAVAGPILGIWLSYVAIEHTRIGIASTIMATPPLMLIPMAAIFLDDRITSRAVVGTLAAVAGVAVLFLV